jgi:orotate phosphoribosyltransferase
MDDLAAEIRDRCLVSGDFVLRSGRRTDVYFDKYRAEGDPDLLLRAVRRMEPEVPAGTDLLAGLELGGVPLAVILSQLTGLPTRFVRKQPKDYGTRLQVEGGEIDSLRVTVVEDVVTSGGAVVDGVDALRAGGAIVDSALCLILRDETAVAKLAEHDVELRSAFTLAEIEQQRSG